MTQNGSFLSQFIASKKPVSKSMMEDQIPKPPIGLIPKKFHEWKVNQVRFNEIVKAINRYNDASVEVPQEWFDELVHINKYMEEFIKSGSGNLIDIQPTKVLIAIENGIIQRIISNNPDIYLKVMDFDDKSEEEVTETFWYNPQVITDVDALAAELKKNGKLWY
jgi:hypothetical protein